jgi:hypothetical protein
MGVHHHGLIKWKTTVPRPTRISIIGTNIRLISLPFKTHKTQKIKFNRRLYYNSATRFPGLNRCGQHPQIEPFGDHTRMAVNTAATMPKPACPGKWHLYFCMEKLFGEKSPFPIPVTPDFPAFKYFSVLVPRRFLPFNDYAIPRSGL